MSTDEDMLIVRFESEQDFWREHRRDLDKLEALLVDAARAGVTVRELMNLAPEPDPEIAKALAGLVERGVIALQRD